MFNTVLPLMFSMRAVHWNERGLKVDSRCLTLVCFTFNVQHEGCALE